MTEFFHSVALATGPEPDSEVSAPFEVLRAGDYDKRDLKVTTADLDAMVANFKRTTTDGHELPVDQDHSFAEGGTSRAVGWFKELVRKGESLFARVQWTKEARDEIANGHFKFFSSEFHPDWTDEHGKSWGPTMLAGALTNRPFVRGMKPVTLSEDARAALADVTRSLADVIDLSVAERPAMPPKADTKPDPKDNGPIKLTEESVIEIASGDETITLTVERLNELVEGEKEKATENVTLKEQNTALSTRISNLESSVLAEQLTADLGQARREGRIDAKDETTKRWTERYADMGRDKARALLFEFPAETIAMSERGHGEDKPTASNAPEGVDPERHALHERAVALAEEKDIDYADAIKLAQREQEQVTS